MSEEAKLKAKVVVDGSAKSVFDKISGSVVHLGEKVHEVQGEIKGMLKQSAAVALGFQFDRGLESVKEFGLEIGKTALAEGKQKKELAGILSMVDKTGQSYEELRDSAGKLHEELKVMGIDTGVASDSMIEAFSTIAERSSKSKDEITHLVESMAQAGKIIPGGVEAISNAYRDLETGIVRPKNALVTLMKMSGVVGGTQKQIAKGISNMMQTGHEKEAFELAEKAIAKMGIKAKEIKPGFGSLVQSMKDIREMAMGEMGAPIIKALVPALTSMKGYLTKHRDEIVKYAEHMGEKVGVYITAASVKIEKGFSYLKNHAKEIQEAIEKGASHLKDVLTFAVENRNLLMAGFYAKQAAPLVSGAVGAAKGAAGFAGMLGAGGAFEGSLLPLAGGSLAASAAGLLAFAAAIAAVSYAAYEGHKLAVEVKADFRKDSDARRKSVEDLLNQYRPLNAEEKKHIELMGERLLADTQNTLNMKAQTEENEKRRKQIAVGEGLEAMVGGGNYEGILEAYNKAVAAHDEGQIKYIAHLTTNSAKLQDAFLAFGANVDDGMDALVRNLDLSSMKVARFGRAGGMHKADAGKPPMQIFTGNINIKQDFKDEDPDRISVIFRRDLANAAANQAQSLFSGPFGGM